MPHYLFSLLLAICLTLSFSLSAQDQSASGTSLTQDTLLAKQLLDTAQIRITKGNYQAAMLLIDSAGLIYEKAIGKQNLSYANYLSKKGGNYFYLGNYNSAIETMITALNIRLKILGEEHLDVAASYNNLGTVFMRKGPLDQAIFYLNKALNIRLKLLGEEHPDIAASYNNLGLIYDNKDNIDSALYFHERALQLRLKILGEEHVDAAYSYLNLGVIYCRLDYKKAIFYSDKAERIFQRKLGYDHPNLAYCYNTLGIAYHGSRKYDQAIAFYEKGLQIRLKAFGENHPLINEIYNNLVITYDHKSEYDRSLYYGEKALNSNIKLFGEEHFSQAAIYNNLANSQIKARKDINQAIFYVEKALKIWKKAYGEKGEYISFAYNNLGNIYSQKGDFDESIVYYKKAVESTTNEISKSTFYGNIGADFLKKQEIDSAIYYHRKALDILQTQNIDTNAEYFTGIFMKSFNRLGEAYLEKFKVSKDWALLKQAQEFILKSTENITSARKMVGENNYKELLANNFYGVYEDALQIDYLFFRQTHSIDYLQDAFQYVSQNKSQLLYETILEAEALRFSGIPDSLLKKEYDLRINITYNDKKKQNLLNTQKSVTDSIILEVSNKLFDLRQQYETLKKRFETDYPDYYKLKYALRTISTEDVQRELLQPGQTMLEYFVGDSSIFVFVIHPDTLIMYEVKKDFPLEEWVNQLREGLLGYHSASRKTDALYEKTVRQYTNMAYQLYQKLIEPFKKDLTTHLLIIPDGVLGYVPFEALLSAVPKDIANPGTYPYLLREHQISYCYSATLLREMQQKKRVKEPSGTLLAVAPFYTGDTTLLAGLFAYDETMRKDLAPLQHSGEEVYRISKLWKGDVLTGTDATETKFTEGAGNYRILHLATHGRADERVGDYSFLSFSEIKDSVENELLYVRDLYNLQLNADLVVLSACETGLGKLSRGEGIISLARAFAYAGAKSIVTTLWSVNDAKTKDVMVEFYRNLKKGLPKDAALRQAKLDYLKSHTSPTDAHPYYWAGFAPIGDMRALR